VIAVALALAGALGAVARFWVDGELTTRAGRIDRVPRGTLIINLTGSFALGLLTGGVAAGAASAVVTIAGTGFLGGYTTFSTASLDTARMVRERRWADAAINGPGMLMATVALVAGGFALGGLIPWP
jgi:CrcB protein